MEQSVAEMDDLDRRLAAVEERLFMREPAPMDRISGIDLRLDALQNLMQSLAMTQSQQTRMVTEVQTKQLEHDRQFAELRAGQQAIVTMLSTLIDREPDNG